VVLGEERQDGAGALGAAGDVVLFQDGLVAVVADGVEVAVEPGLAGGQAERPQRLDQAGEQFLVGIAADSPGVAAQVGGLGQGGQPEGERQPGVVASVPAWEMRGLRAHLASSRVPIGCQAGSARVEG